jgi:hypothetical protein
MNEIQILDLSTIISEMGTTEAAKYLDKTYSDFYSKKLKSVQDESYNRGRDYQRGVQTWWNRIGYSIYCLAAAIGLGSIFAFTFFRIDDGQKMLAEELAACKAGDPALCMRLLSRTDPKDTDRNLAYNTYYSATKKKLPGVFYDPRNGDIVFSDIEKE